MGVDNIRLPFSDRNLKTLSEKPKREKSGEIPQNLT
jgi:hypothetical protein